MQYACVLIFCFITCGHRIREDKLRKVIGGGGGGGGRQKKIRANKNKIKKIVPSKAKTNTFKPQKIPAQI